MEKMLVSGVAADKNATRIAVIGLKDEPGIAFHLFNALAKYNINVDIILQSVGRNGTKDISFTVNEEDVENAIRIIEENQLYLLDRPDGERLYASRMGRKVTDPEGWFADQSSVEPAAGASPAIDPDNYRVTINAHNGYNVYQTNGVHYVLAKEGDTFENIGQKFRISARNLRKFNDLKDKKAQPLTGEVVYIERKKKRWEGNAHTHICRQGETAYAVGQSYAIRTRSIEKLNRLKPGSTLEKGQQIRIK